MTLFRVILAGSMLLAWTGCRASQRTDLESYGRRDAVACLQDTGGSAAWAATECAKRKFSYDSGAYELGWEAVTRCASQKDGDAPAAAQACENASAAS